MDLQLGTSLEDIQKDEKPVIDSLLEGFKARLSMQYIKNLKKVLSQSDHEKMNQIMSMAGFGFKLGVKGSMDFEFTEADEIKEHPMLEQFAT